MTPALRHSDSKAHPVGAGIAPAHTGLAGAENLENWKLDAPDGLAVGQGPRFSGFQVSTHLSLIEFPVDGLACVASMRNR